MANLFARQSLWIILGIVTFLGLLLHQLIQIDFAKQAYKEKVETTKPVIEIKINQK